jgi:hypothetical protein
MTMTATFMLIADNQYQQQQQQLQHHKWRAKTCNTHAPSWLTARGST